MLQSETPTWYSILADSAFTRAAGWVSGKILRARKANEQGRSSGVPRSTWMAAVDKLLERAMTYERQSAEWGVRAIKGPFRRLTTILSANSDLMFKIIPTYAHLYKLIVRKVGLNLLRTVCANQGEIVQPMLKE